MVFGRFSSEGGHEDVHGIVDVHQLVFVADEVQRVDFEWKQVFQLLRLVAEDDDTQLFPEFGMLVSQQSARFYQVVNAFRLSVIFTEPNNMSFCLAAVGNGCGLPVGCGA